MQFGPWDVQIVSGGAVYGWASVGGDFYDPATTTFLATFLSPFLLMDCCGG